MITRNAVVVAALAATVAGCGRRGAEEADARGARAQAASAAVAPARAEEPFRLAAGTPAGGLREWTVEVRRGLQAVPALAQRDPAGAQKRALELYLTRQEYIEMYWGAAGKLTRGPELAPAVKEAESRFHTVLEQLQPGKTAGASTLRTSIAALGAQYDVVLRAASNAAAPPDPHAVAGAAGAVGAAR